MKSMKKLIVVITVIGILTTAAVAFAATVKTPAEIASELTGKPVEDLYAERAAGKTYGSIANDEGKLEEFKAQMLEQKKAILDQLVTDGRLTEEQAGEIYNSIKNNQAECDGTGSGSIGKNSGVCFGQGCGIGRGQGIGKGGGNGFRGRMGSCTGLSQ